MLHLDHLLKLWKPSVVLKHKIASVQGATSPLAEAEITKRSCCHWHSHCHYCSYKTLWPFIQLQSRSMRLYFPDHILRLKFEPVTEGSPLGGRCHDVPLHFFASETHQPSKGSKAIDSKTPFLESTSGQRGATSQVHNSNIVDAALLTLCSIGPEGATLQAHVALSNDPWVLSQSLTMVDTH